MLTGTLHAIHGLRARDVLADMAKIDYYQAYDLLVQQAIALQPLYFYTYKSYFMPLISISVIYTSV